MGGGILESIRYLLITTKYNLFSFTYYRAQFVLWLVSSLFISLYPFIAVTVIYSVSTGIQGWNYYQLLFLSSTASAAIGIITMFISISEINYMLIHGRYDAKLLRPYNKLAIISGGTGFVPNISNIMASGLLIIYSLANLNVTAIYILEYVVLSAFGIAALALFLLMLTSFSYRYFRGYSFIGNFTGFIRSVSNYPLTVYGTTGVILFTVLLPIGTAYFYPAEAVLGNVSSFGFALYIIGTVLVGSVSYKLFNMLIKGYTGSGSAMR
jgi:ABC-2 type transport system permease protein